MSTKPYQSNEVGKSDSVADEARTFTEEKGPLSPSPQQQDQSQPVSQIPDVGTKANKHHRSSR